MVFKFNTPVLDDWLKKNQPLAVEKLAVASGMGAAAILKIRRTGHLPRPDNVCALAEAMRVDAKSLVLILDQPAKKRSRRTA